MNLKEKLFIDLVPNTPKEAKNKKMQFQILLVSVELMPV